MAISTDGRPLSPHLQVWKWHITMATSILQRVTGMAQYFGIALLVGWLLALATGPEAYAAYEGLLLSWFGRLVLFGFTVSITFHMAGGIRYLFWDMGKGFTPKVANFTSALLFLFCFAATAGLWLLAYFV